MNLKRVTTYPLEGPLSSAPPLIDVSDRDKLIDWACSGPVTKCEIKPQELAQKCRPQYDFICDLDTSRLLYNGLKHLDPKDTDMPSQAQKQAWATLAPAPDSGCHRIAYVREGNARQSPFASCQVGMPCAACRPADRNRNGVPRPPWTTDNQDASVASEPFGTASAQSGETVCMYPLNSDSCLPCGVPVGEEPVDIGPVLLPAEKAHALEARNSANEIQDILAGFSTRTASMPGLLLDVGASCSIVKAAISSAVPAAAGTSRRRSGMVFL
eukprot:TRINITY_DN33439_c0_g1_i1.p1 TRINITY_DN33439_c0_g1~~TRINITY_DN33439_c0_g1_i1.p1  ORF type:complete len:270 (-),score=37.75 TRINITY_DN33439_c0_g1_i1:397-1206(-)